MRCKIPGVFAFWSVDIFDFYLSCIEEGEWFRLRAGRGWEMFRPRASDFLCGQKVTKEPSKGRGISISPFP